MQNCLHSVVRDVSLFSEGEGHSFGGESHNFSLLSRGGSQLFSRFFRGGS